MRSGKVKDIYEVDDTHLLFHFTDRVSAFDVKFPSLIPRKGEVLCKFAEFWFKNLPVKNHYVRREDDDKMVVKKMDMVPIECVVRGYLYGSLVQRWRDGKVDLPPGTDTRIASKLPHPIFDPTTKSEEHDIPVTMDEVLEMGLASEEEYHWLEKTSLEIYDAIYRVAKQAGFILADLKLEFGRSGGEIILGDSIGPDEFRMWPEKSYVVGKTQESYDKQLLRDWLAARGFQKQFEDDRKHGKESVGPELPHDLCEEMSSRYVSLYAKITGTAL